MSFAIKNRTRSDLDPLHEIMAEFDETINVLTNKPE